MVWKIDPYCPDYDGDGIPDDGGSASGSGPDGWWSQDATCSGGNDSNCDDNNPCTDDLCLGGGVIERTGHDSTEPGAQDIR